MRGGKAVQKVALFNERDQERLLEACTEREFVPIWLGLRLGMHSHDVLGKDKLHLEGEWLSWKRCKTGRPRKFLVPPDVLPRLERWFASGRKYSRDGYRQVIRRVGERIGIPSLSSMSLRHSFAIHELRKYRDRADAIDLVAASMGCRRETLMSNYLDLLQWEHVHTIEEAPVVEKKRTTSCGLVSDAMRSLSRQPKP